MKKNWFLTNEILIINRNDYMIKKRKIRAK